MMATGGVVDVIFFHACPWKACGGERNRLVNLEFAEAPPWRRFLEQGYMIYRDFLLSKSFNDAS